MFPWDIDALLRRCAEPPQRLPMGAVLLRGLLTESEQEWLYRAVCFLADPQSGELASLRATSSADAHRKLNPDNRPQPFCTWIHPYTRQSNARSKPTKLLKWAESLMHALVPESRSHCVDSMLAQLYAPGGSLLKHRDEDLSWGIGVSLGSAASFDCLPADGGAETVLIRSGDILVGEFGKMPHAVKVPAEIKPLPTWWSCVDHFGVQARCNILFREALSDAQLRALAEERSLKVYGVPLEDLKRRTGKDDAFLAVHLRHAALE